MQKPSNHVQILAVAYYVEGMQDEAKHLSYKMPLIHRMKPAPRVSFQSGYHRRLCLRQTGNQRQGGCCFSHSCQVGESGWSGAQWPSQPGVRISHLALVLSNRGKCLDGLG